jgi:alanyl-tRNA synthetase
LIIQLGVFYFSKGEKRMKAQELRRLYVNYFVNRGHKELASASLLPENDPSVLFTTAGMHPLVPYLLGERHPMGKRLVSIQKCLRTDDIDEVGDETHHTFFEMLGNWSLGAYFKDESIEMSYHFLTSVLGIPAQRLAVTVFEGYGQIPRDDEAYQCWKRAGLNESQIFLYGMKENWWGPVGKTGPCGPDTEIFYDTGKKACSSGCGPACHCGKYVEIWNNVFMQYNKLSDGSYVDLGQKNVDTGMGLERIYAYISGNRDHYKTDLFWPIIEIIEELTGMPYSEETCRDFRIIADHTRAVDFILGDYKRMVPSNTGQGYILRRLIRRVIRLGQKYGVTENMLLPLTEIVIFMYGNEYVELKFNHEFIIEQLTKEHLLFSKTLDSGMKMAEKYLNELGSGDVLSGEAAFRLYDTFGFPLELTQELATEKGMSVDAGGFRACQSAHQARSRSNASGAFSGGLADHSVQTARLHTATHLLNGALRKVLGDGVFQRGSNINADRLRFDFSYERKLTEDELKKINDIVNEAISKEINVNCEEMTVEEAKASGAIGVFEGRYGEIVKVYDIDGYSREICGGPHAANTGDLGLFRIIKEESAAAGVRRIKATVESCYPL